MIKPLTKLIFKTLSITFFIQFFMIFLSEFTGDSINIAFNNSVSHLFTFPTAFYSWGFMTLLSFITYLYLKPIFIFYKKTLISQQIFMIEKNRAMNIFNKLDKVIPLCTVFGFAITNLLLFADFSDFNSPLPYLYGILESGVTGLFTSYFLVMSLENILYPIKSKLMIDPPLIKPKYRSFYRQFSLVILLLLGFLCFQTIAIATEFYLTAFDRASEIFMIESISEDNFKPEILFTRLGEDHRKTRELMNVFLLKIGIYLLISLRLLILIKKLIKNPLNTVEDRLEQLTSKDYTDQNQIDIVNNDEFSIIYKNINKLIQSKQNQLETSEERLHTIINNAVDPIMTFNEEGDIYIFNPAAERLFGWSKKEVKDIKFSKLFDQEEDYRKSYGDNCKMFIDVVTNKSNKLTRLTGKKKDGEKVSFEVNFSQSETKDGTLHTAIIRDITEQIEFEDSLKKAKLAAEKANNMKSEFLANMSHELRTPLNAVLGFTQLLNSDKNLTDNQIEKLNIISRSGEHLLGLINDILDISKIEAGKIELHETIFNVKEFSEDLKQMMELRCKKKGLALYVEYVEPLPKFINCDLGKLRQIMINILGNAIKFTKEGGISIVVGIKNGKLRFSVNDTGKGIPKNEINSILQPFTQSSITDNEGGTGLGLAITNSFIKMMGGELEIESTENIGSTFSFEVNYQVASGIKDIEEDSRTVIGIENDRHPKVIIVDDKINNRLILKEMLEKVGFVTIEAENGLEAVERSKEFNPELVFMDIKMPVMDGYQAVKMIKNDDSIKNIPVFALTASAFKHNESNILSSGFDGFLAKPFKLNSLFKLINDKSDIKFLYEAERVEHKDISIDDLDFNTINKLLTKEILYEIDDLALINDFAGIKTVLEPLRSEIELVDFINSVFYLTDNFDDDNLQKLLGKIKDVRG